MPGNEMILLMICHLHYSIFGVTQLSIYSQQSASCKCQLTLTQGCVLQKNGFSAVKVTGMIIRGEKSKPKNICRASNKTRPKSLDPKFLFWISNPKKKFLKDHTTQEINGNWIYRLLTPTAGIHRISTKVMYTTFQIVVNTQKNYNDLPRKYLLTITYWELKCLPCRVWLLSMGSTVTSVFVRLLLISCCRQCELNYHKLQKNNVLIFSVEQFLFLVCP